MADVGSWLRDPGLDRRAAAFRATDIDGEVRPELTEDDPRELGLPPGSRKAALKAVALIRAYQNAVAGSILNVDGGFGAAGLIFDASEIKV